MGSTDICSRWRECALDLKPGKLSEDATRYIFRWMRIALGWPSAERVIYTHQWISRQKEHIEVYHDLEVIESTPAERKEIGGGLARLHCGRLGWCKLRL